MSTKHTPGPWGLKIHDRENWLFPHVEIGMRGSGPDMLVINAGGFDKDTHEANARLIAAAPELLEALENLLDEIDEMDRDEGYTDAVEFLCWKIREAKRAVAKARGITP